MATGLNKTKHRIASIKSTQKITKAMGMVSTVKMKRFREAKDHNALYATRLRETMALALSKDKTGLTHYAQINEKAPSTLYIVITSTMGLCGGYNSNIFKYVDSIIKEDDIIAPIGEKGVSHFDHDPKYRNVDLSFAKASNSLEAEDVEKFSLAVKEAFNEGKYREVKIIYTKYVNSLTFNPSEFTLLPISEKYEDKPVDEYCPPIMEPSPREMIHALLPQYLSSEIYSKLLESLLSEQASRNRAMDTANDNADELIAKLTIEYNKARQGAITQEITEVVSGSNAQQ